MSRITIDANNKEIPLRIQLNDQLTETFLEAFKATTRYLMEGTEGYIQSVEVARKEYLKLREEME